MFDIKHFTVFFALWTALAAVAEDTPIPSEVSYCSGDSCTRILIREIVRLQVTIKELELRIAQLQTTANSILDGFSAYSVLMMLGGAIVYLAVNLYPETVRKLVEHSLVALSCFFMAICLSLKRNNNHRSPTPHNSDTVSIPLREADSGISTALVDRGRTPRESVATIDTTTSDL